VYQYGGSDESWETSLTRATGASAHKHLRTPRAIPDWTIECPPEFRRPDIILDVNTAGEYDFLAKLYDDLYPRKPTIYHLRRYPMV
jgi:hypothetical protein